LKFNYKLLILLVFLVIPLLFFVCVLSKNLFVVVIFSLYTYINSNNTSELWVGKFTAIL